MSNESNNQDMSQLKDSKRNPYFQKEKTTEMTENTYHPGYTLKSSNEALDTQKTNQRNQRSSSHCLEEEYIQNNNDSLNKNEHQDNKKELTKRVNASNENNINNEEFNDNLEEPLYIMTLELERGKSEKLRIYPDSDPYSLAVEFCRANNLDEDAVEYLTCQIENLINKNKFITGDENDVNNENFDNTQEEYLENFIPDEEYYNGNVHYDYGNRNSSRNSNNSGKNYKYSNLDDVEYVNEEYNTNDENNLGFDLENNKKSNRNSKENFYNYPEIINHEVQENLSPNSNSNRKNYISENIPYLVHEQITEVDEENNITIERLKSSKTENDNSRSPIEKENEIVECNEDKNNPNNSHLINQAIKDEDYTENYLTGSEKSKNKEYNDAANQLKSKMSDYENISRSQENILEKESINNIQTRSNYHYFKNKINEMNYNGSVNDKSRIIPNDIKYSDSQIYIKDNISKDSNNNLNINQNNQNKTNPKENVTDNNSREDNLTQNNEENFSTFKNPKHSIKKYDSNLNRNSNSNIENLTNSNNNITFKDHPISNKDDKKDFDINYNYNQNINSDLNKTIKKNRDVADKNYNPLSLSNNVDTSSPLKLDPFDSKNRKINNSNTKSSEKMFYIADNINPNGSDKQTNSKDKDSKSIINLPKYSENYNSNNIIKIYEDNINMKDQDLQNKEYPDKSNKNMLKNKVSDYEINQNKGGRNSQNSSSMKRPNSRTKYQPLAERVNNLQDNHSNNSRAILNNNQNPALNHGYMSYSNINNKILNNKEDENKYIESKESADKNNYLKDTRSKESKSVSDNSRINSNKILDHVKEKTNPKQKDELKNLTDNIISNNINNFMNSIENEITSIKGTQSSNNDKYDKETKDKSDVNNLNNLNNLLKANSENKNDESNVILNNNTKTNNTQINIQNTKSNVSHFNENIDNNFNQKTNLNQNPNLNNRNIVYRNGEIEFNYDSRSRENFNKKVYFSNEEQSYNKESRNIDNDEHTNEVNNFPNRLTIDSLDKKNYEMKERNKNIKKDSAYNPTKLYNKNRIVSIHEHKCINKNLKLKSLSIFERLYRDAEIKRILPKKVIKEEENEIYSKNNKINVDTNLNFGEILYAREKISKEEKDKKLMLIKYEQDINQMKDLTFKPEIHEFNNVSCRFKYYLDNHYEYNRVKENKTKIRISNNNKDGKNLYLNPTDNIDEEEKKGITTRHSSRKFQITDDQVTAHFIRNEKKREKLIKEENSKYTFHPKIGNVFRFDQNFEERQMFYSEISEKNMKQLKEVYGNNLDLKTGQPYFKPNLISKPQKPEAAYLDTSDNNNRDIFSKLYNQAIKNKHQKEINANKLFNEINYCNKVENNSETEMIYNKIKKEIFSKIFKILDYDYDEIITGYNIFFGMKKLDDEIKNILQPLAIQLREENETLIESEFIRAMEDLYELSSYNDKRILIDFYKKIKNKSVDKIVFERNNNSRLRKSSEEQKFFDEHRNTKSKDNLNANKSIILDFKSKRKNNNSNKELVTRGANSAFSFRPKINKKSEVLARKHDEKMAKEINEINQTNYSTNIDSEKFFKNTTSTINTSINRLGGIQEFTFNNFKNKGIININKNNNIFESGPESNQNYESLFPSDRNFMHPNNQIKIEGYSTGIFNNYNH